VKLWTATVLPVIIASVESIQGNSMILATLETPNFLIQTITESRADAARIMQGYWQKHCEATGADINYFDMDAVRFDELEIGQVLCR
jgi:hypothetical protein